MDPIAVKRLKEAPQKYVCVLSYHIFKMNKLKKYSLFTLIMTVPKEPHWQRENISKKKPLSKICYGKFFSHDAWINKLISMTPYNCV